MTDTADVDEDVKVFDTRLLNVEVVNACFG
jgi:hypothetical protein